MMVAKFVEIATALVVVYIAPAIGFIILITKAFPIKAADLYLNGTLKDVPIIFSISTLFWSLFCYWLSLYWGGV